MLFRYKCRSLIPDAESWAEGRKVVSINAGPRDFDGANLCFNILRTSVLDITPEWS